MSSGRGRWRRQRGQIDPAGIATQVQLFTELYRAVCHEVEARQADAPVIAVTVATASNRHAPPWPQG